MSIFLPRNINYKEKPSQYGDFSFVQSSLFENADRIGIDPYKIKIALPMWEALGNKIYNYSCLQETGSHQMSFSNTWVRRKNERGLYFPNSSINGTSPISISSPDPGFWHNEITTLTLHTRATLEIDVNGPQALIDIGGSTNGLFLGCRTGTHTLSYCTAQNGTRVEKASTTIFSLTRKRIIDIYATYDHGVMSLYVDGKLEVTDTNGSSVSYHDNNPGFGGTENADAINTTAYEWGGVIFCLEIFSQTLNPDQIAFLSDNPYYLWQPRNKQTWFIPTDATGSILFYTDFKNLTNTSTYNTLMDRQLNTDLVNVTNVQSITQRIIREILSNISNLTFSSDLDVTLSAIIDLIANIQNTTNTQTITNSVIRKLLTNLTDTTNTASIVQAIIRTLDINLINTSNSTLISTYLIRELISNISNLTLSNDIAISLEGLVNFLLNIQNTTDSTNIIQESLRKVITNITNNTNSSNLDIKLIKDLLIKINNQTVTNNITAVFDQIRSFIVDIINTTDSSNLTSTLTRQLNTNFFGSTLSADLQLSIRRLLNLNLNNSAVISAIAAIVTTLVILPSDSLELAITQDSTSIEVIQDTTDITVTQDITHVTITQPKTTINLNK